MGAFSDDSEWVIVASHVGQIMRKRNNVQKDWKAKKMAFAKLSWFQHNINE
jgi:hypothetical protein